MINLTLTKSVFLFCFVKLRLIELICRPQIRGEQVGGNAAAARGERLEVRSHFRRPGKNSKGFYLFI